MGMMMQVMSAAQRAISMTAFFFANAAARERRDWVLVSVCMISPNYSRSAFSKVSTLILFALTGVFLLVSCLIPARSWWLGLVLLLAASAATVCMIFMYMTGEAELRFDGNLGIVIDFIVYGLLSFGYLYAVLKTFLNASDRNHVSVSWGWGWIPFLIASVPVVLDHYYQWNISLIVLMALAAYQAGFCIWTFVRFVRGGKVLAAIPVILVYLASSVAASAVISSFVTLFSYGIWI